jgi:AraC family transcriptional regulator, arabinose operon regulatory protein
VAPETPSPEVRRLLTGHERRGPNWCRRPRGTPTALLIHARAGRAVLRAGAAVEYPIESGDTVLWMPDAPQHFGSPGGAEPWEIIWAHFRPDERWPDPLGWPLLDAGVARIAAPAARTRERIDRALLEMHAYAHSTLPHGIDLALNALERAVLWLDAAGPGAQRLDDRVQEAVLFIARHLDCPLTVRAIADAVHLSPSRLAHLFTEQVGTAPARFVELRRIERALALLESTSLSIGAIAEATGYSSQYYFATRFKAVVGVTPSAWRRRARTGQRAPS